MENIKRFTIRYLENHDNDEFDNWYNTIDKNDKVIIYIISRGGHVDRTAIVIDMLNNLPNRDITLQVFYATSAASQLIIELLPKVKVKISRYATIGLHKVGYPFTLTGFIKRHVDYIFNKTTNALLKTSKEHGSMDFVKYSRLFKLDAKEIKLYHKHKIVYITPQRFREGLDRNIKEQLTSRFNTLSAYLQDI